MLKQNLQVRTDILSLQMFMEFGISSGALQDASEHTPVEHFFTPVSEEYGCAQYARQLFMPAGTVCVGKLHKLPHLTFLLKGRVVVVSENGGKQEMVAPLTFVSPAGSKRAFHVLEDTLLTTVHLTKYDAEESLPQVEDEVISPTYGAMGLQEPDLHGLEAFLEGNQQQPPASNITNHEEQE